MAATFTVNNTLALGGTKKLYYGTFSLDSSYPTGGEAVDLASNESVDTMWFSGSTQGYHFNFVGGNVVAYRTDQVDDPQEEVPDTTDLSAVTAARFWAIGS